MINLRNPADLRALWSNGSARRRHAARLLAIYGHDWISILDEELRSRFLDRRTYERLRLVADTSFNPLRWSVDKAARIYSRPAFRTVPDAEPADLEPYTAGGEIDLALDRAEKLAYLCREVFVRPLLVRRPGGVQISLDIITPDRVEVVPAADPLAVDALIYSIPHDKEPRYVVWSADYTATLDAAFEVVESRYAGANPYGLIPVLPLHAEYPARAFWHDVESTGIERATLEAGVAMTNLRYLMKMQSFKQLAILGMIDKKSARLVADPGQVLEIPHGSVQLIDWTAKLGEQQDVIQQQIGAVLAFYGHNPEAVRGKLDASSGYALELKMHELQNIWEQQRQVFRVYERGLYDIARRVFDIDVATADFFEEFGNVAPLPPGELTVEFAEIGPGRDPKEQADLASALQVAGFSRANALREVYGKDDEWISQNAAELLNEDPLVPASSLPDNGIERIEEVEGVEDEDERVEA